MKKWAVYICLLFVGGSLGAAGTLIGQPILKFFGPPQVTLINLTGTKISGATISLGSSLQKISSLEHGQSKTVYVTGKFGESSTLVEWADPSGNYSSRADDYMEPYGSYHSTVVLTPDKKAQAVNDITR